MARREGFQKVYDLAERVIPAQHRETAPARKELVDWACRSAIERLVFATSGELAAFWDAVTPAEAAAWCKKRLGRDLVEVAVEAAKGGKPRSAYARPDFRERLFNPSRLDQGPAEQGVSGSQHALARPGLRFQHRDSTAGRGFGFFRSIEVQERGAEIHLADSQQTD